MEPAYRGFAVGSEVTIIYLFSKLNSVFLLLVESRYEFKYELYYMEIFIAARFWNAHVHILINKIFTYFRRILLVLQRGFKFGNIHI
jgi:hypothetical protein